MQEKDFEEPFYRLKYFLIPYDSMQIMLHIILISFDIQLKRILRQHVKWRMVYHVQETTNNNE